MSHSQGCMVGRRLLNRDHCHFHHNHAQPGHTREKVPVSSSTGGWVYRGNMAYTPTILNLSVIILSMHPNILSGLWLSIPGRKSLLFDGRRRRINLTYPIQGYSGDIVASLWKDTDKNKKFSQKAGKMITAHLGRRFLSSTTVAWGCLA